MVLKPCIFFRQFFFLLDYLIISISLILEVVFHVFKEDIYQSLVGLLVLVRIWRFVRIGHGIVEITNEMAHKEYDGLLSYVEELEKILTENNIDLPESDDSVKKKRSDQLSAFLKKYEEDKEIEKHVGDVTTSEERAIES